MKGVNKPNELPRCDPHIAVHHATTYNIIVYSSTIHTIHSIVVRESLFCNHARFCMYVYICTGVRAEYDI